MEELTEKQSIEFEKEFHEMAEKVYPLFDKIAPFWNDLHLECWQGIFSFGTHWRCKGLPIEKQINSPENGKLYCNTLLEIYPVFKEFVTKWGIIGQEALFRFSQAVGPGYYEGLLYERAKRL